MIIEKNWPEVPNSWPQKRENNIGNRITAGAIKRELWFGPTSNPFLPETLKFPLLTTVQVCDHWSVDKMILFMNQYWWGNINKATWSAYFACPTCLKHSPREPVCTAPDTLNCTMDHSSCGKWILYSSPLSHGYKCFRFVCFPTWPEPFHVNKLLPLLWIKYHLENLTLPMTTGGPILHVKYYSKSVLFGQSHSIFPVLIIFLQD